MKIRFLILFLGLFLLSIPSSVDAQPRPNDSYVFTLDTLANTGTVTFTYPWELDSKKGMYAVSYQVEATQLSGTTDITATVGQSNAKSGSDWVATSDTLDLDGTSDGLITIPLFYGVRSQLSLTGTGTQSTQVKVIARVIQRE